MATSPRSDVVPLRKATKACGPERSPQAQVALADLAARRWALWMRDGRVRELGPRIVAYDPRQARREVRVDRPGRRGFAP